MSINYFNLFPSGYYSHRNPLATPADRGEDTVFAGQNAIHSHELLWKRRPGMSRWSTYAVASDDVPMGWFDWYDGTDQNVIVDGYKTVRTLKPDGTTTLLFTKGGSGNQGSFVAVQDVVYMSSNATGGLCRKRIGTSPNKVWGITAPTQKPTFVVASGAGARIGIGVRYRYVWKDSSDGHISSASPLSDNVGPQDGVVSIAVTVRGTTINTRVTDIDLYRTKDGGSTLFFCKSIANPGDSDVVITDDVLDDNLNTELICPTEHSNDPALGLHLESLVYHVGRVWGITPDQTVRASANNIDGIVNGVPEECFNPKLTFKFPAPVALKPSSEGLLVFTKANRVYIIRGTSVFDFDVKEIYFNISILTQNAVCKDGDNFYAYTTSQQILQFGQAGVSDLGFPISNEDLADFDPANSYLTVVRKGTKAALYLSNNSDKIFSYCFDSGTWSTVWTFDATTVGAVGNVQVSLGNNELLMGSAFGTAGYVYKLNEDINTDDTATYAAYIQFGSYMISEVGSIASLDHVVTEASVTPTVTLLIQEITGTPVSGLTRISEHPLLPEAATLYMNRHYPQTTTLPTAMRHFQVRISWDAGEENATLYGFGYSYTAYA